MPAPHADNARAAGPDPGRRAPSPFARLQDTAALFALALAVYAVVLVEGKVIPNIDHFTHYRWLTQFHAALAEGTWYPLWMPRARLGLGELLYNPYPLYYYLNAALVSCGLEVWTAIKAMAIGSAFAGGLIIHARLRSVAGRPAALLAAAFWIAAPFPLFLFTHYGALPWQFCLVFALELCFATLLPGPRPSFPRVAATTAALVASHVLVGFMVLTCLGATLVALAVANRARRWQDIVHWGAAAATGAALLAFYILPARAAQQMSSLYSQTAEAALYLNWKNSFLFPLFSSQAWGMRWPAVQWVYPGLALAALIACVMMLRRRRDGAARPVITALAVFGAFGLLFGSELALPLYAAETPFRALQWPYRFNTVAAIGAALALPCALVWYAGAERRVAWPVMAGLAAAAMQLLVLAALLWQVHASGRAGALSPRVLNGEFGQAGTEFKTLGPRWRDYVAAGGLPAQCAAASATCSQPLSKGQHRIWEIDLPRPAEMVFPLFAFPGWDVRVDGRPADARTDAATGLIALPLAAGRHAVEIRMRGLPQQRTGAAISLAALSVLLLVSWRAGRGSRARASADERP